MTITSFNCLEGPIITYDEFPLEKAKKVLKNKTIAMIGYETEGAAQSLNLKDNGFNVVVGQKPDSDSWKKAIEDGWLPGKNLFTIELACEQANFITYLLSDTAQIQYWPSVEKYLTTGKTLCFSHNFAIAHANKTNVIPPKNIDVLLIAPKGPGHNMRQLFLENRGINVSYAVYQNKSHRAEQKALAFGIGIGAGYLFRTTFNHEIYSALTHKQEVLMSALAGMITAQYQVLRQHGHSAGEAFNQTIEELTQNLIPLIAENGMDWICVTDTKQDALSWMPQFKQAIIPVFELAYQNMQDGKEPKFSTPINEEENYQQYLAKELAKMQQEEIWQLSNQVRNSRPC